MELARDPGELPSDEPQPELNPMDCEWLPSYVLFLSFPVGPLPVGSSMKEGDVAPSGGNCSPLPIRRLFALKPNFGRGR